MFLSFSLLLIASIGGLGLTYAIGWETRFMTRLLAGHVIGISLWGTVAFAIGFLMGIDELSSALSLCIALTPALMFLKSDLRQRLSRDWKNALTSLQGNPTSKALGLAYYVSFLILFIVFFDRAMIVRDDGIFTGSSNNFGDLPAHLGAIFAFTEGAVFPPDNPSFAGSTFTYPFLVDLVSALLVSLGAAVQDAMLVQNVILCFAMLLLLERFATTVSGSSFVGRLTPALFFFGGGLGFLSFAGDYLGGGRTLLDALWDIGKDYTIGDEYRWGNPMTTLLITQRSFLIGLPLALIALTKIWETTESNRNQQAEDTNGGNRAMFMTGLLTGMLPLVHVHTLAALFVVCAVLMLSCTRIQIRRLVSFGLGVAVVAIPLLLWLMSDSASQVSRFIRFQEGWETDASNLLFFWMKNTGILIPLAVAGVMMVRRKKDTESGLLNFCIPFLMLFVIGNFITLAPWGWDNIKILVYWFIASLLFVGIVIEFIWRSVRFGRVIAGALLFTLVASGGLDVWRVASGQVEMEVFNKELVGIADEIRKKTPKDALFVHEPSHNSPLVLTGRRSLMRYTGHLFSYGIDYKEREEDVRHILSGGEMSREIIERYGIDYILVTEQERSHPDFDEAALQGYPVVIAKGMSRVYKVDR
jgi:hypothetical protein